MKKFIIALLILSGCGREASFSTPDTSKSDSAGPVAISPKIDSKAKATPTPTPTPVPFSIMDCQGDFCCGIDTGTVFCALGGEDFKKVSGISGATQIPQGSETEFCFEAESGKFYCTGQDLKGYSAPNQNFPFYE